MIRQSCCSGKGRQSTRGECIDHFLFDSLKTFDYSALTSLGDLPFRSTHHNYHHAIVLSSNVPSSGLEFTVSHLTLTWTSPPTFNKPSCLTKRQHLPNTRNSFSQPLLHLVSLLKVGEWKNKKPNWVQVVPEVVKLETTTLVRILDELS